MLVSPVERRMLSLLRRQGPLSRWELHERTSLRPNTVGEMAARLLSAGLIREGQREATGLGRPRVPLEIDPSTRQVLGIALKPGTVAISQLNLQGHLLGRTLSHTVNQPRQTGAVARSLLVRLANVHTLAIGVSATGFVDPEARTILLSSAVPSGGGVKLDPIYEAAGYAPVVLENDMHALAARWMLTHDAGRDEDVLLVSIRDGAIGAAMLIDGKPNRGCVVGGNELGHTRFFVQTERCYCGHSGCLERIWCSAFLSRQAGATSLMDRVAAFDGDDPAVIQMLGYLAMGLANAVNFVRPNRLVLVSDLSRYPRFNDELLRSIRMAMLGSLADRVRIDLWDQPLAGIGETAGWLALASIFHEGWSPSGGRASQNESRDGRVVSTAS